MLKKKFTYESYGFVAKRADLNVLEQKSIAMYVKITRMLNASYVMSEDSTRT